MRRMVLLLLLMLTFVSCEKATEEENSLFPYTDWQLVYLGAQDGLTSDSSDEEFGLALTEVLLEFATTSDYDAFTTKYTVGDTEFALTDVYGEDGEAEMPEAVWDIYWDSLLENEFSIGSCWGFAYVDIPSPDEDGAVYFSFTIVSNDVDVEVLYVSVIGVLSPLKSASQRSTRSRAQKRHWRFNEVKHRRAV